MNPLDELRALRDRLRASLESDKPNPLQGQERQDRERILADVEATIRRLEESQNNPPRA